jgi:hypothetical protein
MPIKPGASENEQEFISRCMSEENASFPDEAQRYAVCKSKWDRRELSKQKFSDPLKRVQSKLNFEKKYEGINLINFGENSSACWENYIQVGTKILDGKEVPDCRGPIEGIALEFESDCLCKLAEYPWEDCVAEQTDKYGSKDIAEKVCGAIKSKYGN